MNAVVSKEELLGLMAAYEEAVEDHVEKAIELGEALVAHDGPRRRKMYKHRDALEVVNAPYRASAARVRAAKAALYAAIEKVAEKEAA